MNEPSKFYTQHHAVEAPVIDGREFRPFWRVRTRLDQLLADRAITFSMWRAGVTFRRLAELVLAGQWPAKGPGLDGVKIGGGYDITVARRIDAIDRLGWIRLQLGGVAFDLLEAHAVDDVTWVELGKHYGVHAKTVRNWTIAALALLAEVIWSGGRDVREKL